MCFQALCDAPQREVDYKLFEPNHVALASYYLNDAPVLRSGSGGVGVVVGWRSGVEGCPKSNDVIGNRSSM